MVKQNQSFMLVSVLRVPGFFVNVIFLRGAGTTQEKSHDNDTFLPTCVHECSAAHKNEHLGSGFFVFHHGFSVEIHYPQTNGQFSRFHVWNTSFQNRYPNPPKPVLSVAQRLQRSRPVGLSAPGIVRKNGRCWRSALTRHIRLDHFVGRWMKL